MVLACFFLRIGVYVKAVMLVGVWVDVFWWSSGQVGWFGVYGALVMWVGGFGGFW